MDHIDIATPSRTKEILEAYGLSAKKSLGQNFVIDTNILNNMIAAGHIDEETTVIEVGPGIGALTEQIAKRAREVFAFEIDTRFLDVLEETLSPYSNVNILHKDILKADLESFQKDYLKEVQRIVVIANLPYYITTPIILGLLESQMDIDEMVLMMQKEVASRLSAEPSTKAYGSLSIAVQYYMEAEMVFTVPKTVFMPQPNVESAVIRLTKKAQTDVTVKDEAFFFKVVRAAFVQRRKTLWNNLKVAFGKAILTQEKMKHALETAEVDPKRRGETLSIQEFARLSDALYLEDLEMK